MGIIEHKMIIGQPLRDGPQMSPIRLKFHAGIEPDQLRVAVFIGSAFDLAEIEILPLQLRFLAPYFRRPGGIGKPRR